AGRCVGRVQIFAECGVGPPDTLRSQLHGLSSAQLVAACTKLRPDAANLTDPVQAAKTALDSLAGDTRPSSWQMTPTESSPSLIV
ncbi:hypothetical protein OSJ16_25645, partial [Mycobacterium ulcerans]